MELTITYPINTINTFVHEELFFRSKFLKCKNLRMHEGMDNAFYRLTGINGQISDNEGHYYGSFT